MRHTPTVRRAWLDRPSAMALVIVLAAALLAAVLPAAPAHAAGMPSSITSGGTIISDEEFFDSDSMTVGQVQKFLEQRVPSCKATTGPACLRDFVADLPAKAKDAYCGAVAGKRGASAAHIVVTISRACGLNPQVVLVMLQKEQGLVTATKPAEWSYRAAMGMNCPDTAPCSAASAGFVNQVYLGVRQQQVYANNPTRYNYRAGQVNTIQWHPNSACGSSRVYIANQATANLYIYTPYRPNMAALAAGYATGDSCSSYGNRNFYNYYVQWFSPSSSPNPTGAPARVAACTVPASGDVATASGSVKVKVTTTTARTAPTNVCANTTTLTKDTSLTLTGRYGAWARVKTPGGKTLWVSESGLTSSPGAPATGGNACTVPASKNITAAAGVLSITTANLNGRKAPSTSCSTGVISLGFADTPSRTGVYGNWWRITHKGATYWIHSDYAVVASAKSETPVKPAVTMRTSAEMPLRVAPVNTSTVVRTLPHGTKVVVSGSSGKWRKVTVGSAVGWVSSLKLVDPEDASGEPPVAEVPGQTPVSPSVTMQTTASIPLRASPSESGAVRATLAQGSLVVVSAASGRWRFVTVSGGANGWVSSLKLAARTWGSPVDKVTLETAAAVPLRPAPSTSTVPITTLAAGTKVVVSAAHGRWRFVTVDGKATGWVSGTQLRQLLGGTPVSPSQTLQTATAIPLRPLPATSNTPLATLPKGTKVVVSRQAGKWRYVTVGSRTGWVSGLQLTAPSQPASPAPTTSAVTMKTKKAIPLRSAASATSKVVTSVGTGVKVIATASQGRWRKVIVGSQTGWMSSLQLSRTGGTWTTTSSLNLRSSASSTGKVQTVLEPGTRVTVTAVSGAWRKVTVGSRVGWVSAAYLK